MIANRVPAVSAMMALLVLLGVTACVSSSPTPTSTHTPVSVVTPTPTPTPTPVPAATPTPTWLIIGVPDRTLSLAPTLTPTPTVATLVQTGVVVSIVDGDTLDVEIDRQVERVRLIGVDTPEVHGSVDCYGPEASAATSALAPVGTQVELEKDVSERDRYGRLLRYVYLPDKRMLNEVLVAQGFAQVATYPPDVRYQERFSEAQRAAREQGIGLWGGCVGVALTPTPKPTPTPTGLEYGPPGSSLLTPVATPIPTPTGTLTPIPTPTPRPTTWTPVPTWTPTATPTPTPVGQNCSPYYPDVCIPPPPPDLDCGDIPYRNFRVLQPDPHRFDGDKDGIGCEK